MSIIKPWKSARKRKASMRKIKNVCWSVQERGRDTKERHNIFCDCVTQALEELGQSKNDSEKKKMGNLRGQEIFIAKAINENFELFKGKRI